MKSKGIAIAITTALLACFGAAVALAVDDEKYSLVSPGGIAFSEFRGYEDWAFISSARTDKELKVIVANPIMIEAFKAGVPGNGRPFPEGSKMAKLQWTLKKSTEAQFEVEVPNAPTQAFLMEKDSKRFPRTGGWGYAVFDHIDGTGKFKANEARADCGHACHVAVKSKDYVFHPYQAR